MTDGNRIVGALIAVVIVFVMLYTGVAALDEAGPSGELVNKDQIVVLGDAGEWIDLGSTKAKDDETVRDSRGLAYQFTGADDSHVTADADFDISSDANWTVSQGVIAVNDTTETQTFLSVGDPDLLLQYVNVTGGQDNFSAVYMTATDSFRVNVSAPNASKQWIVTAVKKGHNLTIYRGNATSEVEGDTVNTSQSNQIGGDLTADGNFHGILDETRTFDRALNQSDRQAHRTDPVAPLPGRDRTARIMYDERSGSFVHIFFASVDGTASNVTRVSGFDGSVMSESGLLGGGDYEWDTEGPRIRPLAGGDLDGAPAAYVESTEYTNRLQHSRDLVLDAFDDSVGLAAIIPLMLLLVSIIGLFVKLRGM